MQVKQPDARLEDLDVREVSIVDRPAIKRRFLIVKRDDTTEGTMARRAVPAAEFRKDQAGTDVGFADILGLVGEAAELQGEHTTVEKAVKAGEALKVATDALEALTALVEESKKGKKLPDDGADRLKKVAAALTGLAKKVGPDRDEEKARRGASREQEAEKRRQSDKEWEEEEKRRAKEDEDLKGGKLSPEEEEKRRGADKDREEEKARRQRCDEEEKAAKEKEDEEDSEWEEEEERRRTKAAEEMEKAGGDALKAMTAALGKLMAIVNQLKGMDAGSSLPPPLAASIRSVAEAMLASVEQRAAKKSDEPLVTVYRSAGADDGDPVVVLQIGNKMARKRLSDLEKAKDLIDSIIREVKGEEREAGRMMGKAAADVAEAVAKTQSEVQKGFEAMAEKLNGIVERVDRLEGARPAGVGDADPPEQRVATSKGEDGTGLWTSLFR